MQFQPILLADHTCPNCTLFLLLALLGAFLLGLLLGYILWHKYKGMVAEVEAEKAKLNAKLTDLEKDHASLRYSFEEAQKSRDTARAALRSCEADKGALRGKISRLEREIEELKDVGGGGGGEALAATTAFGAGMVAARSAPAARGFGTAFKSDNLQIIEGIGPKIEQLLKNNSIGTWGALAAASVGKLKSTLQSQGNRFRMHDPTTWPKQAQMAVDGRWNDLIAFQKELDPNTGPSIKFQTPSKVETLAAKLLGFSSKPNDLKIVEGIGPKVEALLKDAGINNWTDLSNTSVARLSELLATNDRFRLTNPKTWPDQAKMAAEGRWEDLKEYQDFLQGGVEPGA